MVPMDIQGFEKVILTENKARLYFRKKAYKKSRIFCTRCAGRKIYRLAGRKYRCKTCGYTFHDFADRWINRLNCSFKTWLWLIKLFELEVSALRAAVQCKISYPTALKAFDLIRYAILSSAQDAWCGTSLSRCRSQPSMPCWVSINRTPAGAGRLPTSHCSIVRPGRGSCARGFPGSPQPVPQRCRPRSHLRSSRRLAAR